MTSRQLRLLRGAAASSIATITAAVSHTVGGGAPPHPLLVIALSVFLTPIAALLVGRAPRISRLASTVLVSQAVFHVLFVVLGATLTPGIAAGGGHQHAMTLSMLSPGPATVAPDLTMLVAHLVAGLFTIAMLWRGEQLLRAIARWVHAALRTATLRVHADWPVPAGGSPRAFRFDSKIRTGDLFLRGPPRLSCG